MGGKESTCNAGEAGSIPGSGRSPGGGDGNPLQYSCMENSVNRGAWRTTAHRSHRVDKAERLRAHTHTHTHTHTQSYQNTQTGGSPQEQQCHWELPRSPADKNGS